MAHRQSNQKKNCKILETEAWFWHFYKKKQQQQPNNLIGDVMATVLASSAVDCGFARVRPKTYNIGICCFSAKHTALRRTCKDCLAPNQNNVSE